MNELTLQKKAFKQLRKILKSKNTLVQEMPYVSGSTDIFAQIKSKRIAIELKLMPNMKLFEQLHKQRFTSNFLVAITERPAREKTIAKWSALSNEMNVNLIYLDQLEEMKSIKEVLRVKNNNFSKSYTNSMRRLNAI